ncbi:MAG: hypothetical protein WBK98_07290, partial [Limnochordia bacterium]
PVEANPNAVFAAILALGVAFWVYRMTRSHVLGIAVAAVGLGSVGLVFWLKPELYHGFVYHLLGWFSVFYHFGNFQRGVLALSSIVYYLSLAVLVLFLTVQILEKRRWS